VPETVFVAGLPSFSAACGAFRGLAMSIRHFTSCPSGE
jgi:hypothetical protein